MKILPAEPHTEIPWLVHGFSTRGGGSSTCYGGRSLNLGFTRDDSRELVEKKRKAFLPVLGAAEKGKPWPLITLKQIHSSTCMPAEGRSGEIGRGDALLEDTPGAVVAVKTADCIPGAAFQLIDGWGHDLAEGAQDILDKLSRGDLPVDYTWPPERVELFRAWITEGMPQ